MTRREIADGIVASKTSISSWTETYHTSGIEAIKKIKSPISVSKRDKSNDQELLESLKKEFKELKLLIAKDPDTFSNTKKRVQAVGSYLKGKSTADIANRFGVADSTINYWVAKYDKSKMKGLKDIDKYPLTISKIDNTSIAVASMPLDMSAMIQAQPPEGAKNNKRARTDSDGDKKQAAKKTTPKTKIIKRSH